MLSRLTKNIAENKAKILKSTLAGISIASGILFFAKKPPKSAAPIALHRHPSGQRHAQSAARGPGRHS